MTLPARLDVGAELTCSATRFVTQGELEAGGVTATVSAVADGGFNKPLVLPEIPSSAVPTMSVVTSLAGCSKPAQAGKWHSLDAYGGLAAGWLCQLHYAMNNQLCIVGFVNDDMPFWLSHALLVVT